MLYELGEQPIKERLSPWFVPRQTPNKLQRFTWCS